MIFVQMWIKNISGISIVYYFLNAKLQFSFNHLCYCTTTGKETSTLFFDFYCLESVLYGYAMGCIGVGDAVESVASGG